MLRNEVRFFNPRFMRQFFPEHHTTYAQSHPKYTVAETSYQMMSRVDGMSDEYVRLGHAINKYAYLQRKGMDLVQKDLLDSETGLMKSDTWKNSAPRRYLWYGPLGIGKRTSLAACMSPLFTNREKKLQDCIFIFIPNALDLIYTKKPGKRIDGRGFGFNNAEVLNWVAPFRNKKNGGIDHPRFSNYVLNNILNQNSVSGLVKNKKNKDAAEDILDRVFTKHHLQLTETIAVPVGSSLKKLINYGLQNKGIFGTDCFEHLVKELIDPETSNERPPLIVGINSVHCLYAQKTNIEYKDIKNEIKDDYDSLRDVDDLNIIKSARQLAEGNWQNGVILLSTRQEDQIKGYEHNSTTQTPNYTSMESKMGVYKHERMPGEPAYGKKSLNMEEIGIQIKHSDHPVDLIGDQAFRLLDPHIPIYEGEFTKGQSYKMMSYLESIGYLDFHALVRSNATDKNLRMEIERAKAEFYTVCDKNPGEIFKQAAHY